MSDKLYQYEGTYGILRNVKERTKEKIEDWREERYFCFRFIDFFNAEQTDLDYSHNYRTKTRWELIRLSSAVMGIEFSYAAETAFVSPTLLKIGVDHQVMTLIWGLSPIIGFFATPLLGSLSDQCRLSLGRRRPFIILTAIGVVLGLILVPNGETFGKMLGDHDCNLNATIFGLLICICNPFSPENTIYGFAIPYMVVFFLSIDLICVFFFAINLDNDINNNDTNGLTMPRTIDCSRKFWALFLTILGTVMLDFNADSGQSPSRAYLLDVTLPEDHARGLSTFTIMAGVGGGLGYILGAIDWDRTIIGYIFGGHVRAVFSLITVIFIVCVSYTVTSFAEIPLTEIERKKLNEMELGKVLKTEISSDDPTTSTYEVIVDCLPNPEEINECSESPKLTTYLKSIIFMPNSLKILCLTNLFSWMAHVCYSLYFTDFVGESVFGGDPTAIDGTQLKILYEDGVRFGCWGMAIYSFSCAIYSSFIERLIAKFKAKKVYVCGMLVYGIGMLFMCSLNNKFSVIIFSGSAGIMYSTLFTMPYVILAHYHSKQTFGNCKSNQVRGLGTDIAIVSSMVFLAQFILSLGMGSIVTFVGSTSAVIFVASILSFCGAISATQIMYLDL